jgi:hypothetical protein
MTTWFEDYYQGWTNHDAKKVLDWMTDDVVYEDVTLGHVATGKDATLAFVEGMFAKMSGMSLEYVWGQSSAESYFVEWVIQPLGLRGVSVGTLHDGKISTNRDYWNGAAVPS